MNDLTLFFIIKKLFENKCSFYGIIGLKIKNNEFTLKYSTLLVEALQNKTKNQEIVAKALEKYDYTLFFTKAEIYEHKNLPTPAVSVRI